MKIKIKENCFVEIDTQDYDKFSKYKWCLLHNKRSGHKYAARYTHKKAILMHREIMNIGGNQVVDHIDGNGLNNKRSNIRVASQSQNLANTKLYTTNKSGYRGVSLNIVKNDSGEYKYWRSTIHINGKTICLGNFLNKIDAAVAYDKKAKELFGEFTRPNFI